MKFVAISNPARPKTQPLIARYCASFLCRLRGLTLRRSLPPQQGLLLVQSRSSRLDASIHMLGVFFDIGVVWLDEQFQVVDTCLARRWRPYYAPRQPARYTLEIHPTRLNEFFIGDRLNIEEAWID